MSTIANIHGRPLTTDEIWEKIKRDFADVFPSLDSHGKEYPEPMPDIQDFSGWDGDSDGSMARYAHAEACLTWHRERAAWDRREQAIYEEKMRPIWEAEEKAKREQFRIEREKREAEERVEAERKAKEAEQKALAAVQRRQEEQARLSASIRAQSRSKAFTEDFLENTLRVGQNSVLSGVKNAGKTMTAMELARCVSVGEKFFGLRTRPGVVLYLAYEGIDAVHERIRAWEAVGMATSEDLIVQSGADWPPFELADEDYYGDDFSTKLEATIKAEETVHSKRVRLVIIDTLKAATPGSAEEAKAMGNAAILSRNLCDRLGTHIMLVQHATKEGKTVRGHSALTGDANTVLMCKKGSTRTSFSVEVSDQRQGPTGQIGRYSLKQVKTDIVKPKFDPADPDEFESSVVIEQKVSQGDQGDPDKPLKPAQQDFLNRVKLAIGESEDGAISGDQWREMLDIWLLETCGSGDSKRDATKRKNERARLMRALRPHLEIVTQSSGHVELVTMR